MQVEEEEDQSKRSNVGKKWLEEDQVSLLTKHLSGVPISDIALFLQRTQLSVTTRLYEMAVKKYYSRTNQDQTLEDIALLYKLNDSEKLQMVHEKYKLSLEKKASDTSQQKKSRPQKSITSFMIDKKTLEPVSSHLPKEKEESVNIFANFCSDKVSAEDTCTTFVPEEKKVSKYFAKEQPVFEQVKVVVSLPSSDIDKRLNEDQKKAVVAVTERHKNIFLTGEPGTGKTYTIQTIKEILLKQKKKVAVTALTGTAAVLANAKTLHSFLGIGIAKGEVDYWVKEAKMKHKDKVLAIQNTDVLIIDEVSMLDAELFYKISEYLKIIRHSKRPFGNLQMIFVGDFCQLPPINGEYCFLSPLWVEANIQSIFLKENVRQAKDPEFGEMLRRLRWGYDAMSDRDLVILEEMTKTVFPESIIPTRLYPKNLQVDRINKDFFRRLVNNDYVDVITCVPKVEQKYAVKFRAYADLTGIQLDLELCIGTQVMITRNIDVDEGLVNGTRAVIQAIYRHDFSVDVILLNGRRAHIAYVEASFPLDMKNEITYQMMPLKYAWAISQHKCQGMTLDAIEIDLGKDIFENGQAYVALSRAEHRKNVRIVNFDRFSFKTHDEVKRFYSSFTE